jgi:hypothetical protein
MPDRLIPTRSHWFSGISRGVPVQRAALGKADLSVIHIGPRWSWVVRRGGTMSPKERRTVSPRLSRPRKPQRTVNDRVARQCDCGLFADLAEGAAYAPDLAVVINQQIGRAGWMPVPVSRKLKWNLPSDSTTRSRRAARR